jgi:hypothetical protein
MSSPTAKAAHLSNESKEDSQAATSKLMPFVAPQIYFDQLERMRSRAALKDVAAAESNRFYVSCFGPAAGQAPPDSAMQDGRAPIDNVSDRTATQERGRLPMPAQMRSLGMAARLAQPAKFNQQLHQSVETKERRQSLRSALMTSPAQFDPPALQRIGQFFQAVAARAMHK